MVIWDIILWGVSLLDPLAMTLLLSGGIFIISFLICREANKRSTEQVIGDTIIYLCNEGFVRYERDENGEIEILRIEEDHGNSKDHRQEENA